MRRFLPALVLAALATNFALPASSSANLQEYQEGSSSIGTASLTVDKDTARPSGYAQTESIHVVKPNGGTNYFYWYFADDSAGNNDLAVCYFWRLNGGGWKTPGGDNYNPLTVTFPSPSYQCEQPGNGTVGYLPPKGITASNGDRVDYCAKEWLYISSSWSRSAIPTRCLSVVYDTTSPNASVAVKDANGGSGFTNDPNGLVNHLSFGDSIAWPQVWKWPGNAVTQGYNTRCAIFSRACNPTSDAGQYAPAQPCSGMSYNGTSWLSTCAFNWLDGDGTISQCFKLYEGADRDALPSNLADNTGNPSTWANDNPATNTQTFTATGDAASACGSIVLDRVAPSGTVGASDDTPTVGDAVTFTVAAADASSGVQSYAWGGGGSGTSVTRTFASAGAASVSVTVTDAAGNEATFTKNVTVEAAPPAGGGGGTDPNPGGGNPTPNPGGGTPPTGGGGTTSGGGTTGGGETPAGGAGTAGTGGTAGDGAAGGGTTPPPTPTALRNTVLPKVTGVRRVGKVLTCGSGTWSVASGVTFTYKWKRGAAVIARQTKKTYKLVAADKGKRVTCVVTAKAGARTASATAVATLPVLAALR